MKRKVILDTNALLIPGSEGVDIFTEIQRAVSDGVEFVVMEGTLKELDALQKAGSAKEKAQAKIAFATLAKKSIKILSHKIPVVDDAIVGEASRGDIVATMDRDLKQRLKQKGVDVAVLRQRSYIVIVEA